MMEEAEVDRMLNKTLEPEWFVDAWIFSVIDLMRLPLDKEKVKKLSLEKKIELMDFMAKKLPDPEDY